MSQLPIRDTVRQCLRTFLDSTGRSNEQFQEDTNLVRGLGLTSDEGVDFVLDLCETLHVQLPAAFNPFVHESGQRGLSVSEMIQRVERLASKEGTAA